MFPVLLLQKKFFIANPTERNMVYCDDDMLMLIQPKSFARA